MISAEKRDRDIEKENYDGFFNTLTDIIGLLLARKRQK